MTSSTSRCSSRVPPVPFGPLSTVRYTVSGVDFDMVRVPPGRFVDGDGPTRRELLVSQPFELGVAPVTQALWRAVMGLSPFYFPGAGDRPVETVSWEDSQELMVELERRGLSGFRLPTDAEWAWAARCGVPTRWSGAHRVKAVMVESTQTVLTSSLSSSAVGVFDLSGNVWEWASDRYEQSAAAGVDVQGPASGSVRALRGGGFCNNPLFAHVANRGVDGPGVRSRAIGFRLFRSVS